MLKIHKTKRYRIRILVNHFKLLKIFKMSKEMVKIFKFFRKIFKILKIFWILEVFETLEIFKVFKIFILKRPPAFKKSLTRMILSHLCKMCNTRMLGKLFRNYNCSRKCSKNKHNSTTEENFIIPKYLRLSNKFCKSKTNLELEF